MKKIIRLIIFRKKRRIFILKIKVCIITVHSLSISENINDLKVWILGILKNSKIEIGKNVLLKGKQWE